MKSNPFFFYAFLALLGLSIFLYLTRSTSDKDYKRQIEDLNGQILNVQKAKAILHDSLTQTLALVKTKEGHEDSLKVKLSKIHIKYVQVYKSIDLLSDSATIELWTKYRMIQYSQFRG